MSTTRAGKGDLYRRIADDVRARMRELEPAVQEHQRLTRILAIVADGPESESISVEAHGEGPPPRNRVARERGRPRGRRANQVLGVIRAEPGLTRAELAERVGSRVGYL